MSSFGSRNFHALPVWSACLGLPVFLFAQSTPEALLAEGFDGDLSSGLASRVLASDYVNLAEDAGPDGSNAVKVDYVGYERGSKRVTVRQKLAAVVESATLTFDVKFSDDFQWVLGGKLHGLAPKTPITGGNKRRPEGWSARVMFKSEGRCATYLYDQDETKKWGAGKSTEKPVFTAGQWHRVVLQVRLNDPGKSNGFARILVDEKEVMRTNEVSYRGTGGKNTGIQRFLFNTFHGGQSPKHAPVDESGKPTTVHAWFDNFLVEEGV
ncbi:MAG: polysaccharide lyase [Verrucomicrobiota bacterium]